MGGSYGVMMTQNISSTLIPLFQQAIKEGIFPGAAIAVITNASTTKNIFFGFYGCTDYQGVFPVSLNTVYDLASLTKPLATSLAIFSLIKRKKIFLNETISSLLEYPVQGEKKNITLAQLLNHSTGLFPHQPFHLQLMTMPDGNKKEWLRDAILNTPLICQPGKEQHYSDLDFMLLGMIVEKKSGISLDLYTRKSIFSPLGIEKILFFPELGKKNTENIYAPTEECSWRKRMLCGEVHDDNASAMGGVAGHAGLFGTIHGVAELVSILLDVVKGRKNHSSLNSDDIQKAVRKQSDLGTWGLGFDTRSVERSSSGKFFSPESFGHLGYTGTSFWVDTIKDLAIILLTNRVHPTRQNAKIKAFRPLFHDTIMDFF